MGLFWPAHGRVRYIFRWWVVGAALVLISMPGVVANNFYYLSLLLPGGAALALAALAQNRNPPARNLRVFVHVTDPAGQTVYQQDLRPRPAPGSDIVERYVLTLPPALPEGRYQIRLGWFDPAQGARLPILNPGPGDEHDRAVAADLAVGRGPTYGWYSPE